MKCSAFRIFLQTIYIKIRTKGCALLVALIFFVGDIQGAHAQSCSIGPVSGSYGVVDILGGAQVDTSASFSISCTGTTGQVVRTCVELSPGQTNGLGQRRLSVGSYRLVHELYADPARTIIWGSWGLSTTSYALYPYGQTVDIAIGGGGTGSALLTVYGRVAANQFSAGPGSYIWTMTTAPAIEYAYNTGTSCPTGSLQATSGGSTWTATVLSNCNVSATDISFGANGLLLSTITAMGQVNVTCTNGTPYNVGLNAGTGTGATVAARKMTLNGSAITYSIYQDAAYSTIWGNTINTDTASGTGIGSSQFITMYGRVPAQTTPAPGMYSDTIIVTLTY